MLYITSRTISLCGNQAISKIKIFGHHAIEQLHGASTGLVKKEKYGGFFALQVSFM